MKMPDANSKKKLSQFPHEHEHDEADETEEEKN